MRKDILDAADSLIAEIVDEDHARNSCPARYAECNCGRNETIERKARVLNDLLAQVEL